MKLSQIGGRVVVFPYGLSSNRLSGLRIVKLDDE